MSSIGWNSRPSARELSARRFRFRWIQSSVPDLAMQWCWLPFALAAIACAGQPDAVRALMYGTFLFSFTHQPLTFCLVYGDPGRFKLKQWLFTLSPPIFMAGVAIALEVHPTILAAIAGLWNAEHTLMQRYGITRIYGRMSGQQQGGAELPMLFGWLILAAVWVAADPATPERIAALGLVGTNQRAVGLLTDLQPYAAFGKLLAIAVAVWFTVHWFLEERRRTEWNLAKHAYLASTAMLFVLLIVNPVAGYVGYVGAHAFEYFFIVHRSLKQYGQTDAGGILGQALRFRLGRLGFFAVYLAGIAAVVLMLEHAASRYAYSLVFFTVGALHFWYDTFIWKLRYAPVAASVGAASKT